MKRFFPILIITAIIFGRTSFEKTADDVRAVFETRDFRNFEQLISFRTFLSVGEMYVGYYGSAQTLKLIGDYLNSLERYSFKIASVSSEKNLGYITGKIFYMKEGKQKAKDVFLTLKKIGDNWLITQITIN